jgi:hypothetical protein
MQYLCRGYQQTLEEVTNGALFSSDNSEMVLVKDIELYSLCEHHLLPFIGKAHVAYIPNGKVLGLSKVARIVDMYARRLQIQENLSQQIAEAIAAGHRRAGRGGGHRGPAHVHDDARRGKAELGPRSCSANFVTSQVMLGECALAAAPTQHSYPVGSALLSSLPGRLASASPEKISAAPVQ